MLFSVMCRNSERTPVFISYFTVFRAVKLKKIPLLFPSVLRIWFVLML